MKKISDMSPEQVKEIADIIFKPEKITALKFHKTIDEISFKVYTRENDGYLQVDRVVLRDPFDFSVDAIGTEYPVVTSDFIKFKEYCLRNKIGNFDKDFPFIRDMVFKQDVIDLIDQASDMVDECQLDNWYAWLREKISNLK